MATANMTTRWVETVKVPPENRVDHFDGKQTGLVLRVSENGRKVWGVMFRVSGQPRKRRFTLGTHPMLTLAEARERAKEITLRASQGHDPALEKLEMKGAPTFKALALEYLERHASQKRSGPEDERIIRKDLLPAWSDRKAYDIRRRDIIRLLDGIQDRGAPIAANRTLALVRKMFNWAIGRDLLENNPCTQVKPPHKENRRDRVLGGEEIKIFWERLGDARMSLNSKAALRLVLVTAQRAGEVIQSRWADIDLKDGWWTIPAGNSKNKLEHRIPLSTLALEILSSLPTFSPFLFPAPWAERPMTEKAMAHAVQKNRVHFALDHFTPHDLRRSAASHMAGAGVPRLVISKILNHVETGITAVYDRHTYDPEKRKALIAWGRRLEAILQSESVKILHFPASGHLE